MPFIVVLLTLLGLSLAAPQGDEDPQPMVVPVYAPEIQTKIIELYEVLKAELEEGDDITNVIEPMEPQINEISRKKRSAEASPFFFGPTDIDAVMDMVTTEDTDEAMEDVTIIKCSSGKWDDSIENE
eukprot:TCALIF_12343-PA protein Name:"Protein of unknown function" AED:0.25 eAED:0.25 QI:107/0.5/0.33/0.66/1/1/3/0/126